MEIVFVGPMKIPIPCEKGAIEEIIWRVSLGLRKRNFNVLLFNPVSTNLLSKSLKSVALPFFLQKGSNPLLHFHDIVACVSFASMFRKYASAVLLSFHYPPWITKTEMQFSIMINTLKHLKRQRVLFTAPSNVIVDWLKTKLDADAYLLPNGVDTLLFNPNRKSLELRERLLGNKEVLMCYVARIHPDKNHVDLLRVVKKLIHSGVRNFKLLLIGSYHGEFTSNKRTPSSYFNMLRHCVMRWGLENYVEFVGELPRRTTVAKYLASSDMYVHPSKVEAAIPLAMLEAMASGLPVVAYDLPYYRGYLEDLKNAILVEQDDLDSLAKALETLILQPRLRMLLGTQARMFVESHLDWERVIDDHYIPIYKRLVEDVLA